MQVGRERQKENECTKASGSNGIDNNNACKRYYTIRRENGKREAAAAAVAPIASSIAN